MDRKQRNKRLQSLFIALYYGDVKDIPALTYAQIGELFDISRQRVHQILRGYQSHKQPRNVDDINTTNNQQTRTIDQ